jgi:hypothetical protein
MNTESERGSRSDRAPAPQGPVSPDEEQQALEVELRRFSVRDRLLQLFEWLYPYSATRTRNSRRK